ncbi:putative dual-specificity RNA methyltransferase RlmN [bacterium HR29]|jgi:23S rRNA (adenine2503-C2)-methyltransferase|nr:putative dual-specificity RNA methyltransferase RlmN [bacterium HR29]
MNAGSGSFYRLLPEEVDERVRLLGLPAYRARQLLEGAYRQLAGSWEEVTTLPLDLRRRLDAELPLRPPAEVRTASTPEADTVKALLRFADGTLVETVLMRYPPREGRGHPRATVCVSTQAGCAMGCVFCATGQMGFERNLRAEEIVAQVLHFARWLRPLGQHVTNVVFMGMGEPLANYAETLRAVRILTHPRAFGLAQRAVTISTVGVLSGIEKLAGEGLQVGLAISLHAPNDALRRQLVPTAAPGSVERLIAAARRYRERTGRRVTAEYVLIEGVNDSLGDAEELAHLLRGTDIHVNLIPLNPTAAGYRRPAPSRVSAFARALRRMGINCTVRREKGTEISAACGQLRTDAARSAVIPEPVATLPSTQR